MLALDPTACLFDWKEKACAYCSPAQHLRQQRYQELIAYRKAALDAIWRCDLYPLGMEREKYAVPFSKSESSLPMVNDMDAHVGIFSHPYTVAIVQELWYQLVLAIAGEPTQCRALLPITLRAVATRPLSAEESSFQ